ncbi:MAG: transcription elongation factor GreA [Xanthomonadaceae bacterium]|nr:transcription elongation factor GreA [Rhodospirillaceae bacterium]NIA18210.1 transcription elongation factor GreA [Xanthomonadaceae bacterium]
MSKKFISVEGLEKIKKELEEIKKIKRPELINRIQEAKELGDLSENADYHSAKEEQSFMEYRVLELEDLIKNSIVIDNSQKNNEMVGVGSTVKIKNNNNEQEYTITGSNEADPISGKISNESPLGKEMMDKKVGDEFLVETPKGEVKYKILGIK